MRVTFAFGKSGLAVDLPPGPHYRVIAPKWAGALADPDSAIEHALDHPIGSPPLTELACGKRSAAIAVCDITRPAPNRLTLPPVLRRLAAAGIPEDQTFIFIATGLHRAATGAEIDEILGPEIASSYPVVNHNARALEDHCDLGFTHSGTPVRIDRRWVESEFHVTAGFIEQHLMAGFSGGRKLIAPGLSYQDTIRTIHSPRFMRDARAVEGSIEENPLHRELVEIAGMAGHDFVLDVVLAEERKVAEVFAGDPQQAHRAGIEFVRRRSMASIPRPAGAAITSAAGYPLDLTFYQTVKGVTAASHLVKPGGIILVVSACDEGVGAPEFSRLLRESPEPAGFLQRIADQPVVIDQWQLEKLALVCQTHRVWFYTPGLSSDYHSSVWGRIFTSAEQALADLAEQSGQGDVVVIPEGPYVFARPESEAPECVVF